MTTNDTLELSIRAPTATVSAVLAGEAKVLAKVWTGVYGDV